ncbi:unnamed protein product [Acanthoscelides obtectus]|uniref:Uncharacterized protein n=1 Tax=Acanthoscelides obtectus TaxID=200917 RepID=A0A9P0PCN5_ACAOB|nr:unnamed protein product [Acanthoscelides obtectus]CAK1627670.1 hypothetical protein AOBTE_LOCUS4755 [Acanthoscelides obtectus]
MKSLNLMPDFTVDLRELKFMT